MQSAGERFPGHGAYCSTLIFTVGSKGIHDQIMVSLLFTLLSPKQTGVSLVLSLLPFLAPVWEAAGTVWEEDVKWFQGRTRHDSLALSKVMNQRVLSSRAYSILLLANGRARMQTWVCRTRKPVLKLRFWIHWASIPHVGILHIHLIVNFLLRAACSVLFEVLGIE